MRLFLLATPQIALLTFLALLAPPQIALGGAPPATCTGIEGELLKVQDPVFVGIGAAVGRLCLEPAAGDEDVRTNPGAAVISLDGAGTLAASALRVNEVRNIDPVAGRPRRAGETGSCVSGSEPACLLPSDPDSSLAGNADVFDALDKFITVLFDPAAGGLSFFNSDINVLTIPSGNPTPALDKTTEPTVASLMANLLVGNRAAATLTAAGLTGGVPMPLIGLTTDTPAFNGGCDGLLADCVTPGPAPHPFYALLGATANAVFTAQQQALLGCGEFYGTNCEVDGIDLLNAEASTLLQSWPGTEETQLGHFANDPNRAQPGTIAFASPGQPECSRFEAGQLFVLPGCRGPGDAGYDIQTDGSLASTTITTTSASLPSSSPGLHPFFDPGPDGVCGTTDDFCQGISPLDQRFVSEMAALSFNFVMALAALSSPDDLVAPEVDRIDARDPAVTGSDGLDNDGDGVIDNAEEADPDFIGPFRRNGCSFAKPQTCINVLRFLSVSVNELGDDPSGPPRQRWLWETGAEYAIDTVDGDLTGFAGWTLHVFGPVEPSTSGQGFAAPLLLVPPGGPRNPGPVPASVLIVRSAGVDGILGNGDVPVLGGAYAVPEPSQLLLRSVALPGIALLARRRRRRQGHD